MVSRNCVQTMYNLSADNDPVILRCIAVSLSRLSLDPANCTRIVNDGGTMALCNIAVKFAAVPVISLPTALAFHFLSSRASTRINIAQEGSIVAISALLKQSSDQATLQKSLLTLCNLLIEPETHLVIMQQGLIGIMCTLANHENESLRELVALAFVNLSLSTESHRHINSAGGVPTIIALSKQSSNTCKRRAASVIMNMSGNEFTVKKLVSEGVISALADMINCNDVGIIRYTCAALCRLCSSSENCELITNSGAIAKLVEHTISGDSETKKYCGSTFSFLSFYETCRSTLCTNGIFDALRVLASESDESSRLRCLAAFGNLSCQEDVQLSLVESGIVSIIAYLANSYQENSLLCCAKSLCNLACCATARVQIVRDGGAQALMMIGMVKSSDLITKTVCVRALANLIDESTVGSLVQEGIVVTLSNLCKQPDPKAPDQALLKLCINAFNLLSNHNEAKGGIAERSSSLIALYNTYDCADDQSKIVCARTVANLTLCEAIHSRVLEAGALRVLEQGAQLVDDIAALHCLQALFVSASCNPKYRQLIARSQIPTLLVDIASGTLSKSVEAVESSNFGDRRAICLQTLAVLAWFDDSRTLIQTVDMLTSVLDMIVNFTDADADRAESFSLILIYLTIDFPFMDQLNCDLLGESILVLARFDDSALVSRSLVGCMRELSKHPSCIPFLATSQSISICSNAISSNSNNENTCFNAVALIYSLVQSGPVARVGLASSSIESIIEILDSGSQFTLLCDLCVSVLTSLSLDVKARPYLVHKKISSIIYKGIVDSEDETSRFNAVSAAYSLSKMPAARELLVAANIEAVLTKLSVIDKPELKANIARTIKNLVSDSGETLEEGTISSLIALSLEGKKTQLKEETLDIFIKPQDFKENGEPRYIKENGDSRAYSTWQIDYQVKLGGSTGKGAPAPDPPAMESESSDAYSLLDPSTEEITESEGKTKMAFAKMHIPEDLRNSCKLTDEDFKREEDKLKNSIESGENSDKVQDDYV
jgi:hypothetical protein